MRSLALYGPRMCWFQGARRLLTGGRIGCLIGLAPGEPIVTQIRFDQAGCFWAAGTGVFKPASRASLSARNRAVFSRVAARAVSYSAIACCPSRSCCSFFLKAASARSRARLASVSNLVTPFRASPLAGQTNLPEDRMPPVDVGSSTEPTPFQVVCSARTTSETGICCERTEMGGLLRQGPLVI